MSEYKLVRKVGATSQIFQIFITASGATTFAGLTGLAFNTATIVAYYHKDTDTTATSITLANMTIGTYTSGGFKEIDATNMPGWYQFCPPDAAFSSGNSVAFSIQGVATMRQVSLDVDLTPTPANITQIDGSATSGNNATLNLKKLNIVNNSGDAVVASSTGSNGSGLNVSGNGSGAGITTTGGTTGNGIAANGGNTSGHGILSVAATAGSGLALSAAGSGQAGLSTTGGTNGSGLASAGNGSGQGIIAIGGATGHGINGVGGATSGSGLFVDAVGSGTGITAVGVGTVSILATQGISGPLDSSEKNSIADALLKRDMSAVTGEASRSFLNCLRFIRNKWSISSSTITVTKEDDTTPAWTATLSTDATAVPIVGFDGN